MDWAVRTSNSNTDCRDRKATWGVTNTLSNWNKGWPAGGAACSITSSPAPAILRSRRAAYRAASSRMGPRAQLMMNALGFIWASSGAPTSPRVSSLRGVCTVM